MKALCLFIVTVFGCQCCKACWAQSPLESVVETQDTSPVENLVKQSVPQINETLSPSVDSVVTDQYPSAQYSITLRDMWDREHPDGIQHGHIAYPSTGMYYYHRPYNGSHYRLHRLRLTSSVFDDDELQIQRKFLDGFQYSNARPEHLFRPAVRDVDPRRDRVTPPRKSGVLEFADSARYEFANRVWEEQQAVNPEPTTPATLSSHSK